MSETVKVWRDDAGQWFQIDSRGRPRGPFDKEGCAVLDRLLLNWPPPPKAQGAKPDKVCGTCGGSKKSPWQHASLSSDGTKTTTEYPCTECSGRV